MQKIKYSILYGTINNESLKINNKIVKNEMITESDLYNLIQEVV